MFGKKFYPSFIKILKHFQLNNLNKQFFIKMTSLVTDKDLKNKQNINSSEVVSILRIFDNNPVFLPSGLSLSKFYLQNNEGSSNQFLLTILRNFLNKYYLSHGNLIYQNTAQTLFQLLSKQSQFCIHNGSQIIGFIGRTHIVIQIYQRKYNAVKIGFLAINTKLRNKKLAHALIRSVTKDEIKGKNDIAIFLADPRLISKHFSDVLGSFFIFTRYFNINKYRKLGFFKEQILHENVTDLQNIKFPFKIREIKNTEIQKYYQDYMKYLHDNYDVYYSYDFELFKDFFVNKSKIKNYCIYDNKNNILDYISIEIILNRDSKGNILTTGKLFAYTNRKVPLKTIVNLFTVVSYQLGMDSSMYQNYGQMNNIKEPHLGYIYTNDVSIFLQNCKLNKDIPVDRICISYYY